MNQSLFEGRTLVGMISSIIRQDALRVSYNRIEWDRMFRLADFHRVANIVYLGVLGNSESIPDRWRERFFGRYQEALLFGEHCKESVKEVLMWLDMREISCTMLVSESVRDFYKIPEAAANSPVQIYLDEKNYYLAKGYLIDLGYEADQLYKGVGERMVKISGVPIILYYHLPFRTPKYNKNMIKLVETAAMREPYSHIRMLSVENEFIYRMASAAYRYANDELTLREVLDIVLCHKAWREEIDDDALWKALEEFGVDMLAEKILRIAYMWFGDKEDDYFNDQPEDLSVYDVLEDRMLTSGEVNNEKDEQALTLRKRIQKEIDKEKREEEKELRQEKRQEFFDKIMKKIRWLFPDYHYMTSIFPIVERLPFLLPVFWIVRDIRLLWRVFGK